MADWSKLHSDIIVMITNRLNLIEDFISMRGTCSLWRRATCNNDFDRLWPKLPLLMVPVKHYGNRRDLYSLSRRIIWNRILLPITKETKCMESRGWLITVSISGRMKLLHHFTSVEIRLPRSPFRIRDNTILSPYQQLRFPVKKAVLSESPSKTSNFIIVIVASLKSDFLGFWKPGDKCWRKIRLGHIDDYHFAVHDVNYYNGKMYAITGEGDIFVCDVFEPNPTEARLIFRFREGVNIAYELVECGGDLLVVAQELIAVPSWDKGGPVTNFTIFRLDLNNAESTKMWHIGNKAIFLGDNAAFCVDLDIVRSFLRPGQGHVIRPNCVYFCHLPFTSSQGNLVNRGICMYSLKHRRILPFPSSQFFNNIHPALWISDL